MKRISFRKVTLVILAIAILGFGLSGCMAPPIITTGTAKLVVSGTYYYNLKMDGTTYHSNKSPGTYYITNISPGNHTFEAVDVDGISWGYDSETVYIAAGTTTTIYLTPTATATTGTVQIKIMNDSYSYYIYMDGNSVSGTYLGTTNSNGEGTFYNIPTGYHSFYAISTDYLYDGWGYKTIYTGNNTVQIYTY